MRPASFPALLGGLVLALLACASGCAADEDGGLFTVPGGTPSGQPCSVDQDCPDPVLFVCNTALSRCQAACRKNEDCALKRRGEYALAECEDNLLGCRCDTNRCVAALCAEDADCGGGGRVCRDGHCGAPPAASTAASCRVVPDVVVGSPGQRVRFEVWVSDAVGQPVVPRDGLSWVARSALVSGGGTGPSATFELAAPGAEGEAVEARVGTAACRARVTVLPKLVPPGGVRVLVTDELTGRPVPEATVAVADALGLVTASTRTDAGGVAWVAALGDVSVSVFHPDFGFLTVVGALTEGSRNLRLPLRRNPLDRYGGARGFLVDGGVTTNAVGPTLALGLTGLSSPGLMADLVPQQVSGPERSVDFVVAGQTRPLSLPTGAFLAVSPSVAPEVSAPGVAGVCDASLAGVPDAEDAVRAGACGTRTGWALTADVPQAELAATVLGASADPLLLYSRALSGAQRGSSSVVRDVPFRLRPTPGASTGSPEVGDTSDFASVAHAFHQVPLAFPFVVRMPPLPLLRGAYLDRAWVLGGVVAPGRGLVPLGLGAAVNTSPADPNTDTQDGLSGPGLVRVRMAPAHHGLEGQPYRLVVLASSGGGLVAGPAGSATSAVLAELDAPRFDPSGAEPVKLGGSFLAPPEGARYNFEATSSEGLAGRELRLSTAVEGATLLRATFTNLAGRRWTVWMDSRHALSGVRVPRPPAEHEDRTFWGDVQGSRASLSLQALEARSEDGEPLGPVELAESEEVGLDGLADFTRAVSTLEYGRPALAFVAPEAEGQALTGGATVRVRVEGFRVGAAPPGEGFVRLTVLGGGTGCEGVTVRGDAETAPGSGEVALRLPATCSGSGSDVRLVASLVGPDGVPLRPAVTAVRTVEVP